MKPLLFPFTYVTESIMSACSHFFEGLSVFQSSMKQTPEPMQRLAREGLLDIRLPDSKMSRSFDSFLAETENWARMQGHGTVSFLKGYQDMVPFFGDASVSQIQQDIRAAERGTPKDTRPQRSELQARLFLQMAQQYDAHNLLLSHQMHQHETLERNLYRELRGYGRKGPVTPSDGDDDPFAFMLLDRLRAWARICLCHGRMQGPLVTTHASVLSLIQEHLPEENKPILTAKMPTMDTQQKAAAIAKKSLSEYCARLATTPPSDSMNIPLPIAYSGVDAKAPLMKLYLLPEMAPHAFFARFADGYPPNPTEGHADAAEINTLIGLIA